MAISSEDPAGAAARAPLRVLHLLPSLGREAGGMAAYLESVCMALRGRPVALRLAALVPPDAALRARLEGLGVAVAAAGPSGRRPLALLRWLRATLRDADVVHVHGLFNWLFVLAAGLCRARGVPYVASVHGALLPWRQPQRLKKRLFLRAVGLPLLRRARCVVGTTVLDARVIGEWDAQLPVRVVAPGVTVPVGVAAPAQPPRIVFVGRLREVKGLPDLIAAAALLKKQGREVRLDLVGEGPPDYEAQLRSQVQQAGLQDAVVFHGHQAGTRKWQLLRQAAVFALPSFSENFSFATAEALACGVPVVVTEAVGVAATVARHDCGAVVPPGDPTRLAQALAQLLDPTRREACAARAQQCAEAEFSGRAMGQSLREVYRSALA